MKNNNSLYKKMLKRKCQNCEKKIERSFRFCPWCGESTKKLNPEDYGMLGFDDETQESPTKDPFSALGGSLGSIINQMSKQLSKQLGNLDFGEGKPKGIEIRFSTGKPIQGVVNQSTKVSENNSELLISESENQRRKTLPKVLAGSKIRRLPEGIVYEIDAPGVKSKQDVAITRLENSLEIRAYSKDKCYIKTIPIKVDVLKYSVRDDKVLVQIKN